MSTESAECERTVNTGNLEVGSRHVADVAGETESVLEHLNVRNLQRSMSGNSSRGVGSSNHDVNTVLVDNFLLERANYFGPMERDLDDASWPDLGPLRVRTGTHAFRPVVRASTRRERHVGGGGRGHCGCASQGNPVPCLPRVGKKGASRFVAWCQCVLWVGVLLTCVWVYHLVQHAPQAKPSQSHNYKSDLVTCSDSACVPKKSVMVVCLLLSVVHLSVALCLLLGVYTDSRPLLLIWLFMHTLHFIYCVLAMIHIFLILYSLSGYSGLFYMSIYVTYLVFVAFQTRVIVLYYDHLFPPQTRTPANRARHRWSLPDTTTSALILADSAGAIPSRLDCVNIVKPPSYNDIIAELPPYDEAVGGTRPNVAAKQESPPGNI